MLPILATVALLLAIGIAVACTKDNNQNTAANTMPTGGSKTASSTKEELADALFLFWQQSDSAYRANPTVFLSVCSEEDYDDFYELANITKQQLGIIDSLLDKIPAPILTPDPTFLPSTCVPCVTSLTTYGDNVAAMRAVINELKLFNDSDTVPLFTPYIDSCYILCWLNHSTYNYTEEDAAWCMLNCSLDRERIRMERHLTAIKADE